MILEKIEFCAEEILNKLNLKILPIPVEEIANKLQIKISRAPSGDFSGMLIRKDGRALIGINSNEAPVRQRFSIAHELGHFSLHPRKDTFVDFRDNKKDVMRTPIEKQANMFATSLLMPRSLLEKDFRILSKDGFTEDELSELAEKYQVSEEAMKFRLMNLNLHF
ncbi:MAG: ImmA/IrrE family metallo-endopeptidase [Candidatus Pacebacteria bacterium]|nr:ImmA/IrrE family metallo-endopeptidase [Candidatus Paceibacterota bacterium]MDD5356894.1 ImmA/IrrE family metallo-endopeptidase [Candidatus Paceibacterota bacterium]